MANILQTNLPQQQQNYTYSFQIFQKTTTLCNKVNQKAKHDMTKFREASFSH
jgi:hypothetical protein